MEIILYLIAMIGGSIQYDSEWFLSLITLCIGTPLLVAFLFVRICSSIKKSNINSD